MDYAPGDRVFGGDWQHQGQDGLGIYRSDGTIYLITYYDLRYTNNGSWIVGSNSDYSYIISPPAPASTDDPVVGHFDNGGSPDPLC